MLLLLRLQVMLEEKCSVPCAFPACWLPPGYTEQHTEQHPQAASQAMLASAAPYLFMLGKKSVISLVGN